MITRSQHIPRIQEAQASAYHVLCELVAMIHAMFRGVVGAMAMTGVRVFAKHAGLIREDPPSRLTRKKTHHAPRTKVELVHWAMGAAFGATYGMLPEEIRRRPWSGPASAWSRGWGSTPWSPPRSA